MVFGIYLAGQQKPPAPGKRRSRALGFAGPGCHSPLYAPWPSFGASVHCIKEGTTVAWGWHNGPLYICD